MEINYLKLFQQNPRSDLNNSNTTPNKGINNQQIQELEQLWNNGNQFPTVVKEFLSIGGIYNWIFEGGDQKQLRSLINRYCQEINYSITRPFIAFTKSFSDPQFFIVFLDENQIDPKVYELNLYMNDDLIHYGVSRLKATGINLSQTINGAVYNYRNSESLGLL
ncbi:hypothetical protein ODZ84_05725 [Chryseobacterium fluminis]|uniref:hypothetical protein n=1 Tax=Chryseobacterium fluminis TaxID=2983606 RepID=UPI0022539D0C|nr:hypothetical protein [Chryseobacterium sp. MMS21-Ot14]UZT99067.1 hypothetical protein ODZ84_05725 [Chryseobacterium sp. MMS21-Ot14]